MPNNDKLRPLPKPLDAGAFQLAMTTTQPVCTGGVMFRHLIRPLIVQCAMALALRVDSLLTSRICTTLTPVWIIEELTA